MSKKKNLSIRRVSWSFPLRQDYLIEFIGMPVDLTENDVNKIIRLLRAVAFDEPVQPKKGKR